MSLRRPQAPKKFLPVNRADAIWDLTINNESVNALENQFSRILFQADGADRAILEHDHTAPNQGAFKILGAAGREDVVIDYQTGAITFGAAGTLTLNLPLATNPDNLEISLTQLWFKVANASIQLGSSTDLGNPTDAVSLGIDILGQNNAADPMDANNYSLTRVRPNQLVIQDTDAGVSTQVLQLTGGALRYRRATGSTGFEFEVSTNGNTHIGAGNGAEVQTVYLNNFANLNFANDAAAAAGGIGLGGIYHNAGALLVRIV